jgi:hypothetical protein
MRYLWSDDEDLHGSGGLTSQNRPRSRIAAPASSADMRGATTEFVRIALRNRGNTMDESTIKGACKGYKRGAVFELINGQRWEQTSFEYRYQYQYRPDVLIDTFGTRGDSKLGTWMNGLR